MGTEMNRRAQTPTDKDIIETAHAALASLIEINGRVGSEATCFLGILARGPKPSPKTIRKLEMDAALAEHMRNVALSSLSSSGDWLSQNLLQPFDQRGTQEDDIRCLVVSQTPAVQLWIDALPHRDTWMTFCRDEWSKRQLSGVLIAIVFPGEDEPLLAFARWSARLLLKLKGWVARLSSDRYSIDTSDSLLCLPNSIDFFVFKGVVFAMKWSNFEMAVNFRQISRLAAVELWESFNQNVAIADSDTVWEVIGKSVRNQNTLIKALSHPERSRPTLDKIEQFIRERGLKVQVANGKLHLDPSDKVQISQLMLIMADGFVTSDLTSQKLITLDAVPAWKVAR